MTGVKTTREGQASARNQQGGSGPDGSVTADGSVRSERRAHLVMLAGELFAQKGYRATTVREIADAAGILSGSLYHHFDSKESIGDEILSSFINEVLADYRGAVASAGSPRAAIEQIVRSTSRTLARHRAALAMLQNDWSYFAALPRFAYLPGPCARSSGPGSPSWRPARNPACSARTWTRGSPTGCCGTSCGSPSSGAAPAATAPTRSWTGSCGYFSTGSQTPPGPLEQFGAPLARAHEDRPGSLPPPGSRIDAAGRVRGPLPATRRLIHDSPGPLGDRPEVAGLDQLVGLKMGEGTRAGGRQAYGGGGVRVGRLEDRHPVVLPEHPVVALKAAPDRFHHPLDDCCPVRGVGDKPPDRFATEVEQSHVFRHHNHPQCTNPDLTDPSRHQYPRCARPTLSTAWELKLACYRVNMHSVRSGHVAWGEAIIGHQRNRLAGTAHPAGRARGVAGRRNAGQGQDRGTAGSW